MSDHGDTFLGRCLSGQTLANEIDDYIDRWHEGAGADASLAEYLGFTSEEYGVWVEKPASLPFILLARSKRLPLADVLELSKNNGLAASAAATTQQDAAKIADWLKATGRLPG